MMNSATAILNVMNFEDHDEFTDCYHEISWVANEFVAATEGGGLVNERFEPTTGMCDQYHITVRLFEQDMAEFLKTDIGSLFNRNDA